MQRGAVRGPVPGLTMGWAWAVLGLICCPAAIHAGPVAGLPAVARSPAAIGFETLWMVHHYREVGEVKVLPLDGISPGDTDALAAGRYPLYRTFHVTTWEGAAANPLAERLVQVLGKGFAATPAEFAFAPRRPMEQYGWRFAAGELQGELAR